MCQALFHIRVPTLSSSLIPGGHNNQKGQTTTFADCISIVTASVFDMSQTPRFWDNDVQINKSIPVCVSCPRFQSAEAKRLTLRKCSE